VQHDIPDLNFSTCGMKAPAAQFRQLPSGHLFPFLPRLASNDTTDTSSPVRLSQITTNSSPNLRFAFRLLTNIVTSQTFVQAAGSEALRAFNPSRFLVQLSQHLGRRSATTSRIDLLSPARPFCSTRRSRLPTPVRDPPGLAQHELVVVGDRIFTDVVLGHRLSHPRTLAGRIAAHLRLGPVQDSDRDDVGSSEGLGRKPPRAPLAVWTTGWECESVAMRWVEAGLVRLIECYVERKRERKDAVEGQFDRRGLESGDRAEKAEDQGWFS